MRKWHPGDKQSIKPSMVFAVVLHAVILLAILLSVEFSAPVPIVNKSTRVVHATAIDSAEVKRIQKKLAQEQQAKRDAELAKKRKAAEAAARKKKLAAEKAAKLKQQQQEAKRKAEQARQAKIKQQKALAAKQAAARKAAAEKAAAEKAAAAKAAEEKKQAEALALQKQIQAKQAEQARQKAEAIKGEVDKYKALILEAISRKWLVPAGTSKDISCELSIRVAPGGMVLNVQVLRSSGDSVLDRSAQAAVYKASPLPVPTDAAAFDSFRQFELVVKPMDYLN